MLKDGLTPQIITSSKNNKKTNTMTMITLLNKVD